jgi:RNA polymerase sigma-70 factor (ECF subfamily)
MSATTYAPGGELPGDPDAVIRELYSHYAKALHAYVEQFCPDRASADDIVQETFIRAWRHLPQLSADDRREPGRAGPAGERTGAVGRGDRD